MKLRYHGEGFFLSHGPDGTLPLSCRQTQTSLEDAVTVLHPNIFKINVKKTFLLLSACLLSKHDKTQTCQHTSFTKKIKTIVYITVV